MMGAEEPLKKDQRRQTSRALYVVPVVLLVAASWLFATRGSAVSTLSDDPYADDPYAYEVVDGAIGLDKPAQPVGMSQTEPAGEFVLDASQDDANPRRFRKVGNEIEDAATGIRRPSPAIGNLDRTLAPGGTAGVIGQLPPDLRFGYGPRPSRLSIPGIGVDADVTTIGLDRNRALAVPRRAAVAGWWSGGFVPGEPGPTVVVGHYDSKTAPGVFARLDKLSAGETIDIKLTDGSIYRYFVTEVQRLKKSTFPSEQVYGPTPTSTLRLVTCGGKFDRRSGHYVDNTIVYAELLDVTPSPYAPMSGPTTLLVETTSAASNSTTQPVTTQPLASLPVSTQTATTQTVVSQPPVVTQLSTTAPTNAASTTTTPAATPPTTVLISIPNPLDNQVPATQDIAD